MSNITATFLDQFAVKSAVKLFAVGAVVVSLFGVSAAEAARGQGDVQITGYKACKIDVITKSLKFTIDDAGGTVDHNGAVTVKANCGFMLSVTSQTPLGVTAANVELVRSTPAPGGVLVNLPVILRMARAPVGGVAALGASGYNRLPVANLTGAGETIDEVHIGAVTVPALPPVTPSLLGTPVLPNTQANIHALRVSGVSYNIRLSYRNQDALGLIPGAYVHVLRFTADSI